MSERRNYDPELIRRTFDLAEKGRGTTRPNPLVGAVVVQNGKIVGEGWHVRAGGPHAEVRALTAAGRAAGGGELYVSLEPCSRQGRTPPCTEAIIAAGVRRVIIGAIDPNPGVNGRGMEALRAAGVSVEHAGVPPEFARQNEMYEKHITTGRPFVLLKAAMSLNGNISAATGTRTRLTGPAANKAVHQLRYEYPAVAVGAGTAGVDDPLLTCRLDGAKVDQPLRVVIDGSGRLPLESRLVRTVEEGPVLLAATERLSPDKRSRFEQSGVEVLTCGTDGRGYVDLNDMLRLLGDRDISGLLVEGGAVLNETFLAGGLVDKLIIFVAPKIISGPETVPLLTRTASFSREFEIVSGGPVGDDLIIEAYPRGK